ncbi:MAG: hypothetical protein OEY38_12705 [Gammaproteobacteria bacterium]|nr:hypothetical protein [Gammaproteobacteria bacterium]
MCTIFLLGILISIKVNAASEQVLVVLSHDAPAYHSVKNSLSQTLNLQQAKDFQIHSIFAYEDIDAQIKSLSDLCAIVSVGVNATNRVNQLGQIIDVPNFSVLIPKDAYDSLFQNTYNKPDVTILIDQPVSRLIDLARILLPDAQRLGVMLSQDGQKQNIAIAGRKQGFVLYDVIARKGENPAIKIKDLLDRSDIVLALPDSVALTRQNAKWLLYMAYQNNIPVIGFSKAYVDAGGLAAVYTAPEAIGKQAAELILSFEKLAGDQVIPRMMYPREFSVSVNQWVAKSLNINVTENANLVEELKRAESRVQ